MCLRLTLGHEIGQSKAKYRCLENIFLRFSSLLSANDGKLDWTLRIKLELRSNSFDSVNHLSITLIVWFTGLIKKGTFQLNVVVLLLNLVSQCLTIESHCC